MFNEFATLIDVGAEFHSLAMSLLTFSLAALDLKSSFHSFVVVVLTALPVSILSGLFFSILKG